jgi:hypothetical protein
MSTELRWRIGCWLVGAALLGILASIFWIGSAGFGFFCLASGFLGVLICNPFRLLARLRNHTIVEPVFRIRPIGMIGFLVFLILMLIPYAIGDWLMAMLGERFEAGRGQDPVTEAEEDTLDGFDSLFTPAPKGSLLGRWRTRS